MRVLTAEDFRAARNDCAAKILTCQILNREIDRVGQANQRQECGN